jgi:hypothetical protein
MWALVVIGGIGALCLENATEAVRRKISGFTEVIAATKKNSERLRERLAVAENIQAKLRAALAKGRAVDAGKHSEGHDWLEQLSSDPKLQNRFLAYQRSIFSMKYGTLFQELGLTPEQISKCEDNLIMRQGIYMDVADALRAQGLPQSSPSAQELENQLMAGYKSAQTELLGESGFSQLNAYDQDFQWKTMVADYAGAATVAGITLTSAQMQQLSAAAVQASQSPGARQIEDLGKTYWAGVDMQAASFLTPAQLDLLKSGEFIGPFGAGSRFQSRLNDLITLGDQADSAAGSPASVPAH